jgi:hypothetical protein
MWDTAIHKIKVVARVAFLLEDDASVFDTGLNRAISRRIKATMARGKIKESTIK